MEGITKISLGIIILALVINSYGQGLAEKINNNKFDLKTIETRKIAVRSDRLWTQGIIPFEIKKSLAWKGSWLVRRAIKFWESKTCVKFIGLDKELHQDYLSFMKSQTSCDTPLWGRYYNGKNIVHIGNNCTYETIVRELGHAMGFAFEQDPGYEKLKSKIDETQQNATGEKKQTSDMVYQCPSCGATLQEPAGTFGTPTSSDNSEVIEDNDNNACEWRITGSRGEKIVLNIESLNIYQTPNCTTDYIEVRDGYWSESPLLGRFCGNESIPRITSQSDRMLVTYVKTSDKKDYYGFAASYYKTCGGDIEIDNNVEFLESPNYPDSYAPNTKCTWKINYPQNKTLRMINYFFSLKKSRTCENDFVELRNGYDFNSPLLGRYCGTHMSAKLNATGGKVKFDFYSENSSKDMGFSVLIKAVADDTKSKETNESETIDSNQTCSASHKSYNLGFLCIILLSFYIFIN